MMAALDTFRFLSDYLYGRISPSVPIGYGEGDSSPKKRTEAMLCTLFRDHMYAAGKGYFLYGDNGLVYVYNGKYYEKVTTKTFLQELIKETLRKLEVDVVYQEFSPKKIAEECMCGIENREDCRFIPDRRYIVFANGVLDLKTGKLNEFGVEYRTDIILDIDYDPSATHHLWDMKIAEIIPNRQMLDAFQMFCGSLLVNRKEIKIEYICYLVGPGSNGKSVIAGAVAAVFGEEYFAKFDPEKLLKSNDSMFNIAYLDGKIANFTDDLGKSDISGGAFKRFVSGEEFQARHPYGHKIFKVYAPPLLCCTNDIPNTTDDSWGHHRRQLPIYSTSKQWSEKDKDARLGSKLSTSEARKAIFNWIYAGYKKILANDGNIPLGEEVIEAQIALRDDSNSARRWLRDMQYVKISEEDAKADNWKYLTEWHALYKDYCRDYGEANVQIAKSLAKLFREKGFLCKRSNKGFMFCLGVLGVDVDDYGNRVEGDGNPVILSKDEEELPF